MNQNLIEIVTAVLMAAIVITPSALITLKYCQHDAVIHAAAHYEVNSWGDTSFRWNNTATNK